MAADSNPSAVATAVAGLAQAQSTPPAPLSACDVQHQVVALREKTQVGLGVKFEVEQGEPATAAGEAAACTPAPISRAAPAPEPATERTRATPSAPPPASGAPGRVTTEQVQAIRSDSPLVKARWPRWS